MTDEGQANEYWRAMLRLVGVLLAVWFVVSFLLGIVLVETLNQFRLGGFPLGFWIAQQGSIVVFVLLIVVYVWRASRLARRFGVD